MQLRQQKAAGTTENSFQQLHKAQGSSFPRPSACVEVADPSFQGSSQGLRYQLPVISSPGSRSREQWCLGPQTWCRVTRPAPTGTSEGLIKAKRTLVEGFSSTALCRGLPHPFLCLTVIVCPHAAFFLPFLCGPEHKYGREGCLTPPFTEKMGAKDTWST